MQQRRAWSDCSDVGLGGGRLGQPRRRLLSGPGKTAERAPCLAGGGCPSRQGQWCISCGQGKHHITVPCCRSRRREVCVMATSKGKGKGSGGGTGAAAASAAGKVLSDPKSSKDDKKAAASDLAQKKPKKG